MAYTLPTFNSRCNIYTRTTLFTTGLTLRSSAVVCQLRAPTRGAMGGIDDYPANGTVPSLGWSLLLPKGTDIRFGKTAGGAGNLPDGVQVYPASGMTDPTRWYLVCDVDDAAYGFENEYRIATLRKLVFGDDPDYSWIPPYPAGSDL